MVAVEAHKSKMTQAREESLHGLVARLDIPVSDISILDCAFTHTSYANEHKSKHINHNQRLEFLGDAVLDLIIGEYLFKNYPDMAEGNLTKIKAATVCEDSLASVSRSLQLGQYLLLGHGERTSGGNDRNSILADTFESLIGAIYISTDYQTAMTFVLKHLTIYIKQALEGVRIIKPCYKNMCNGMVINISSIVCSVKVVPTMLRPSIWWSKSMVLLTRQALVKVKKLQNNMRLN